MERRIKSKSFESNKRLSWDSQERGTFSNREKREREKNPPRSSSTRWKLADPVVHLFIAEQPRSGDMREKSSCHPRVTTVSGCVPTGGTLRHPPAATASSTSEPRGCCAAATLLFDESSAARHEQQPHYEQQHAAAQAGITGHRYGAALPCRLYASSCLLADRG